MSRRARHVLELEVYEREQELKALREQLKKAEKDEPTLPKDIVGKWVKYKYFDEIVYLYVVAQVKRTYEVLSISPGKNELDDEKSFVYEFDGAIAKCTKTVGFRISRERKSRFELINHEAEISSRLEVLVLHQSPEKLLDLAPKEIGDEEYVVECPDGQLRRVMGSISLWE